MIDYEKTIHALIDPLVEDSSSILIRELPSHSDRDVTILICASDSDTARLIGRRGVVANALREAMGIAPKAANESTRIHLKFESFDEEDKDAE